MMPAIVWQSWFRLFTVVNLVLYLGKWPGWRFTPIRLHIESIYNDDTGFDDLEFDLDTQLPRGLWFRIQWYWLNFRKSNNG